MPRSLILLLACSSASLLHGQATPEAPAKEQQGQYGYMAPAPEAYQGAWSATEVQRTAAVWRALCDARPADVNAQFNWFRSERNARLSSNNGRLEAKDQQDLNAIAERINSTAPGSFEQHLSSYYVEFPQRQAFTELEEAARVAPDRPELILPMLTRANVNGDKPGLDAWTKALEERGNLSPSLIDVASDLLLSVDRDGIVFTNGDMDGAPALVRQRTHDQRRDVLVIDQRLLADAGYRQRIWRECKAGGAVPGPGIAFARALIAATDRPVFLALSLDRSWFDAFEGKLCATGIAFRISGSAACDTKALEARWSQMKKNTAAGPLGRNYLLPGSILLQQYRRGTYDEQRIARLEFELRTMAAAMGATQELIKAGVLTH